MPRKKQAAPPVLGLKQNLEFREATAEELTDFVLIDGMLVCMSRVVGERRWWKYYYRPGELDNAKWVD